MNRAHCGAVAAGALLLALPGSLRQEPTNPAAGRSQVAHLGEGGGDEVGGLLRCDSTRTQVRHPRGRSNGGQRAVHVPPEDTDGYHIPPHTHPADAHLTVIAGTLNIGFGDKLDVKATKPMPAGSFIVIPRGTHHYYWLRARRSSSRRASAPGGGLRQSRGGPKEEVATGAA